MAYYWTCPNCGCNNDFGEVCDCRTETKNEAASAATETTSGEVPNYNLADFRRKIKRRRLDYG